MDNTDRKSLLESSETIVVKVGSRVLSDPQGQLDLNQVSRLADQLTQLASAGKQVVLVSSGAVACGIGKLGLKERPSDLAMLQAVASVGQAHLIQAYERFFYAHGRHAAQVLLIADDLNNRVRYLNVRNTLVALLDMGVIPVVNENDTIAVDELQTTFGDNDRLAAMVAGLFAKPTTIILSDVDGVYDRDPDLPGAQVLSTVPQIGQSVLDLAMKRTTGASKGGMASKLRAAQFATRSGSPVVIASGRTENALLRIMAGESIGTLFLPQTRGLAPKKRWIGFTAQSAGTIFVDEGAARAIRTNGPSLLAIGILRVTGRFEKGDVISICDEPGLEIARGLTNYNSRELSKIAGLRSPAISEVLGHCPYDEVIHRDNMAILNLDN